MFPRLADHDPQMDLLQPLPADFEPLSEQAAEDRHAGNRTNVVFDDVVTYITHAVYDSSSEEEGLGEAGDQGASCVVTAPSIPIVDLVPKNAAIIELLEHHVEDSDLEQVDLSIGSVNTTRQSPEPPGTRPINPVRRTQSVEEVLSDNYITATQKFIPTPGWLRDDFLRSSASSTEPQDDDGPDSFPKASKGKELRRVRKLLSWNENTKLESVLFVEQPKWPGREYPSGLSSKDTAVQVTSGGHGWI